MARHCSSSEVYATVVVFTILTVHTCAFGGVHQPCQTAYDSTAIACASGEAENPQCSTAHDGSKDVKTAAPASGPRAWDWLRKSVRTLKQDAASPGGEHVKPPEVTGTPSTGSWQHPHSKRSNADPSPTKNARLAAHLRLVVDEAIHAISGAATQGTATTSELPGFERVEPSTPLAATLREASHAGPPAAPTAARAYSSWDWLRDAVPIRVPEDGPDSDSANANASANEGAAASGIGTNNTEPDLVAGTTLPIPQLSFIMEVSEAVDENSQTYSPETAQTGCSEAHAGTVCASPDNTNDTESSMKSDGLEHQPSQAAAAPPSAEGFYTLGHVRLLLALVAAVSTLVGAAAGVALDRLFVRSRPGCTGAGKQTSPSAPGCPAVETELPGAAVAGSTVSTQTDPILLESGVQLPAHLQERLALLQQQRSREGRLRTGREPRRPSERRPSVDRTNSCRGCHGPKLPVRSSAPASRSASKTRQPRHDCGGDEEVSSSHAAEGTGALSTAVPARAGAACDGGVGGSADGVSTCISTVGIPASPVSAAARMADNGSGASGCRAGDSCEPGYLATAAASHAGPATTAVSTIGVAITESDYGGGLDGNSVGADLGEGHWRRRPGLSSHKRRSSSCSSCSGVECGDVSSCPVPVAAVAAAAVAAAKAYGLGQQGPAVSEGRGRNARASDGSSTSPTTPAAEVTTAPAAPAGAAGETSDGSDSQLDNATGGGQAAGTTADFVGVPSRLPSEQEHFLSQQQQQQQKHYQLAIAQLQVQALAQLQALSLLQQQQLAGWPQQLPEGLVSGLATAGSEGVLLSPRQDNSDAAHGEPLPLAAAGAWGPGGAGGANGVGFSGGMLLSGGGTDGFLAGLPLWGLPPRGTGAFIASKPFEGALVAGAPSPAQPQQPCPHPHLQPPPLQQQQLVLQQSPLSLQLQPALQAPASGEVCGQLVVAADPAHNALVMAAAKIVDTFNTRMTEVAAVVSDASFAMRQLSGDVRDGAGLLRHMISGWELEAQRGHVASAMQYGLVVMWVIVVVASVRHGRLSDIAGTCALDRPTRAPEFAAPVSAASRSVSWWGLRMAGWTLGLSGKGGRAAGSAGGASWMWGLWDRVLGTLGSSLLPAWMRMVFCVCYELGVYSLGLVLLFYLLRPLIRATLSVDMRHSWMVDVPLLLGGVWAAVGVQVVTSLGGRWTVWLGGWWLWCCVGLALHARRLRSGWAQTLALAVLVLGLPLAVGLLPFSDLTAPAHAAMEGCWRRGAAAAARWIGWVDDTYGAYGRGLDGDAGGHGS